MDTEYRRWSPDSLSRSMDVERPQSHRRSSTGQPTQSDAGPAFFAINPVASIVGRLDTCPQIPLRLTHPMRYNAARDRFEVIEWGEAFNVITAVVVTGSIELGVSRNASDEVRNELNKIVATLHGQNSSFEQQESGFSLFSLTGKMTEWKPEGSPTRPLAAYVTHHLNRQQLDTSLDTFLLPCFGSDLGVETSGETTFDNDIRKPAAEIARYLRRGVDSVASMAGLLPRCF